MYVLCNVDKWITLWKKWCIVIKNSGLVAVFVRLTIKNTLF